MSLFGSKNTPGISDENEAFFAIIFACIAVDGEITIEEMHDVTSIFQKHHLFGDIDLNAYYKKMKKMYKEAGSCERLMQEATPHLSDKMTLTVFANVMDMVFADGVFDRPEQELVKQLKSMLNISDEQESQVKKVIRIKNQWTDFDD